MFGLIITVAVFFLGMLFFIFWQPTRAVLREIFFNPLKNSEFRIREDEAVGKPKNDSSKGASKGNDNNIVGAARI
ncbi:MAG: hypothetical protein ABL952_01205 [Pyrinomonadaceae bacterium]